MPKDNNIKKVLVVGSGPIIIGQAAEFDYAGTQACRALKEEGICTVLINSNPATIMTDKNIADHVYIEPLTTMTIKKVIEKERPDSVLATLGGQTGLNLVMELADEGYLEQQNVKIIGTNSATIKMAEDRQTFKDTMLSINEPCIESIVVSDVESALVFAEKIGYPVIVRPAYTLGGTGGGIAENADELFTIATSGIRASRVGQALIEKCISGWKEIEFEVVRDYIGNKITICSMENLDPVGVHTGDSIVVAPSQTLADKEYQMLRTAALNIVEALGIAGGCNVQFALHPYSFDYAVIEVNPRVSRSSALASKAAGYPIAKVATKIALGYNLDEIKNAVTGNTYASFEPALDYVAVKIPKWPFDKFITAKRTLGTQMKATGEVMAISPSFEGALMKAIRSLEQNVDSLEFTGSWLRSATNSEIEELLHNIDDQRLFVIAEAFRRNITIDVINEITKIDIWFLGKIKSIVDVENEIKSQGFGENNNQNLALMRKAKDMGFTDAVIGRYIGKDKKWVKALRTSLNVNPAFRMVDTCAGEFEASTPYYYSCYNSTNELKTESDKKKVIVLGSGPIRIGQGIEFDYCSVHSVWALKKCGYEAIIINNNPETVSTDFDIADKLYFEPLTYEDVENIVEFEKPYGAVVQFGGQTAIKLAGALLEMGVKILGTSVENINNAEDRECFDKILEKCQIPRPEGKTILSVEQAISAANSLGYPVLVRPSYVLGGQGMEIAYSDEDVIEFINIINRTVQEHPILVDKYITGKEVEIDAICDGEDVLIPGIMEHQERAGVHSGDSISIYPPQTLSQETKDTIVKYSKRMALELNVLGLINIQYIVSEGNVYVIEANPRSSRTVPYISKVTGIPMVELATRCVFGEKLKDMGYGTGLYPENDFIAIKMPVFSFEKIHGADISLGPEMKSTGEVLGIAKDFSEALLKAFIGAGIKVVPSGRVAITVKDRDKGEIIKVAKGFKEAGFLIYATQGTCEIFSKNGIEAVSLKKLNEGKPNILDLIYNGGLDLIINTPTQGRQESRDGFKIRRAAVERGIPCLTSVDTASALLMSLKYVKDYNDANGIQETGKSLSIIDLVKI